MKVFFLLLIPMLVRADYQPTEENIQSRRWFQDSKFGLFIHWGPYSVLEKGEWVLEKAKLSLEEYQESAVSLFNPQQFDPAFWVALAKDAGMKYITITSRHHDGFAMWPTKQNDWNIKDATSYEADPLKKLAEECSRQGIKLFFYYSQLDWHHEDYFPLGRTGHHSGRTNDGDFSRYLDYMDAQLTELLTEYGGIGGIWFDGMWDKPMADWRLERTYSLIHRLQPAALIGSNHHENPFEGEDFQMFEKDLPGQATQDFNDASTAVSALPLEMCETINDSWGYDKQKVAFKSTKELIQLLVKAAGYNANFLLNIGPGPDGTIQPEFAERLCEIGVWLNKNGSTIYGTRGGPISPQPWGVSTQKETHVYLHVLQWDGTPLEIPYLQDVIQANIWPAGSPVTIERQDNLLLLHLSANDIQEIDTIIELQAKRLD